MNFKLLFFYFVYGAAAFVFFLIVLFPGHRGAEVLSDYIGNHVWNGIENISFEKTSLVFPPGLKLHNPIISLKTGEKYILDAVSVHPDFLTFFDSQNSGKFKVSGYHGVLKGSMSANVRDSFSDLALQWHFSEIDLKDFSLKGKGYDLKLSFKADGRGVFNKKGPDDIFGEGKGIVTLHNFFVYADNPVFESLGISSLDFSRVEIEYAQTGDHFRILGLKGSGSQMKITLKGDIALKKYFGASPLNLKGSLRPEPSFISHIAGISSLSMFFGNLTDSGIPFEITGTLEKPSVRL